MERNLKGFFKITDSMYEALSEIDFFSFPKEWIQQKLRILAHIDQIIRDIEFTDEEKNTINARYRGSYDWYDHFSTAELKKILEMPFVRKSGGWINIDMFGKEASENAWLLAQHADEDLEFQCEVLDLMTPFFQASKVEATHYAYLYDRIQVAKNKPQRYGSQGSIDETDGIWKPFPCETTNLEDLDQQALQIGMKRSDGRNWTLSEYFKHMNGYRKVELNFLTPNHQKPEPI